MRLDRHFETGMKPTAGFSQGPSMSLQAFAFGPMGSTPLSQWTEIYRLAYERTVAALKPTLYDRAMQAFEN